MPKKTECSIMLKGNPSLGENPSTIIYEQTLSHRVPQKLISIITQNVGLTIHLHLMPRLRKSGAIPPLPHMSS
jgi:hypothetical protein